MVGTVRLLQSYGSLVVTVGKQHMYVWQGFCYYKPGWSPIRELVAADVTYSQSHCVTDSNQRAKPIHYYCL